MAKGKTVAAIWVCEETGMINGSFRIMKDKIKDLTRMKYSPRLRKRTKHKAKLVKKGS